MPSDAAVLIGRKRRYQMGDVRQMACQEKCYTQSPAIDFTSIMQLANSQQIPMIAIVILMSRVVCPRYLTCSICSFHSPTHASPVHIPRPRTRTTQFKCFISIASAEDHFAHHFFPRNGRQVSSTRRVFERSKTSAVQRRCAAAQHKETPFRGGNR